MKRVPQVTLFCLLLVSSGNLRAWHTFLADTHQHIASDSLKTITQDEYPDLYMYLGRIQDGSGTESHNTSQGPYGNDNYLNGGLPKVWWDLAYNTNYKNYNFSDAYFNIGRMIHLVQDQGVPAHGANIYHYSSVAPWNWDPYGDNLEKAGRSHYIYPGVSSQKITGLAPRQYYDLLLNETFAKVAESDIDVNSAWRLNASNAYWLTDNNDDPLDDAVKNENRRTGWGSYGGGTPGARRDIYDWVNNPGILAVQLSDSIKYTGGSLMIASELLPPIIPTYSITSEAVNGPDGAQIKFTLLENRLPDVKIDLVVQETGQHIITQGLIKMLPYSQSDNGTEYYYSSADAITWAEKDSSLYPTLSSNLDLLPQMALFQMDWRGEVDGEPLGPREEPYTLVLRVTDHDGNTAESFCRFVVMPDDFPPTVHWDAPGPDGTPIALQVTGTNTLETAPWFHLGYSTNTPISLRFEDIGTGIGSFSIYPPATAPETQMPKTPLFSANFHNGQSFLLSDFTLSDDATGYVMAAVDALGNATTFYFHLDRHPPEINFSTIVIHKLPGLYSLDVYGEASDAVAGLAAPVQITDMNFGDAVPVASRPWPPGPKTESFSFTNLRLTASPMVEGNTYLKFYTYDKSGLPNLSYLLGDNVRLLGGLDGNEPLSPSIVPELILKEAAFKVEDIARVPPPNCEYLDVPIGMHSVAVVEPRDPDPAEISNLNNRLNSFSDVHIEADYTPVSLPYTLFDAYSPALYNKTFDVVLPRFVKFTITSYGNTNPVRYRCHDDFGELVSEGVLPPGTFKYSASGTNVLDALVLYPPLEQPAVQFVPPGLNVRVQSGSLEVIFSEVSEGGQIFIKSVTRYPEVPGYRVDKNNAYDLVINANYRDVKIKACMNTASLSVNQISNAELYHYNETSNAWEKVTTERSGGCVTGISQSASPFVVMVPVDDKTAPQTSIGYKQGVQKEINGKLFVSTDTYVNYYANDFTMQGDITGVVAIYNLIDIEPAPECLLTPFDSGAQKGTCANPQYAGPFKLDEGIHTLHYFSSDRSSNFELPKNTSVYADGTPPLTEITIGTSSAADGGIGYLAEGSSIAISAFDPQSNGVVSGLESSYCLIDVSPEECEGVAPIPAACESPVYSGPFTLPVGTHTIYYSAADKVGNKTRIKRADIEVYKRAPFPKAYRFSGKFSLNGEYFAARDAAGNIYAASHQRVSKYASDGTLITSWGDYGTGPGQFRDIEAIKVGPDGSVYVLDNTNRNIQKFTLEGVYISGITSLFQSPQGLDIGKSGDLYVADYSAGQVVVLNTGGTVLRRISVPACLDVAIDDAGNIYAADNQSKTVKKFSQDGTLLTTFGPQAGAVALGEPFSLNLDAHGNVFVTDLMSLGVRIAVFRAGGEYLGELGTANTTPGGVMASLVTKPVLNDGTGELLVPQGAALFSYQISNNLAAPRIISPATGAAVSHEQVLLNLQAEPGAKVEVLDGGNQVAAVYVDNIGGWFKTSVTLATGSHTISARAVSNMGFDCGTSLAATISVQAQQPAVFSQVVSLPVRGYPYTQVIATTTVTGDFNGDNLADIVAIGKWSYTVLLGRGDGTFDEQLSVNFEPYYYMQSPTAIMAWEAIAGDVNGDGKLDFVLSSLGRLIAALGNGDGTFRTLESGYNTGTCNQQPVGDMDMELADLNADGRLDVLKGVSNTNSPGSCLYLLAGLGDGLFQLSAQKYIPRANDLIAVSDLNNDGRPDVATGQGVYWNRGGGLFDEFQEMCSTCTRVLAGDMTGDGLADLVYDYRQLLVNAGNGKFSAPAAWNLDWQDNYTLGKPAVRDFNGDGVPDIALGVGKNYGNYGWIFAYLGYGDGLLNPAPVKLYVGNNYSQIDTLSAADFNNDAHSDIVTALHFNTEYLAPELALFLNNAPIADVVPPAASVLGLAAGYDGGVRVTWTAPGDDGAAGKAARYELAFSPNPITLENFAAASKAQGLAAPKPAGSVETVNVSGLEGGGGYYFALVSYDEVGNASPLSNVPSIRLYYTAQSAQLSGGRPEVVLVAGVEPAVAVVSTMVQPGSAVMEAAAAQDLSLIGGVYGLSFVGNYDYSGVMSVRYSTGAVETQGLVESDIAIYEYSASGWSRVEGQLLDAVNKTIVAPVNSSSVVCGLLGSGPKLLSPSANFIIYSTAPVFLGRVCSGCSLKVSEGGVFKGEISAHADGFLKGSLNFSVGRHSVMAEVMEGGMVRPVKIYREFLVQAPYALGFDVPVMMSSNAAVNVGATGIGVADFNGDGHEDILVFGKKGYVTALGRGNSQFDYLTPVTDYFSGVFRVDTPDVNQDGKADIIVANYYRTMLGGLGKGDGTFDGLMVLPNQLSVADAIASGDMNGDTLTDVAIAGYDTVNYKYVVSLLKGQGSLNFTRKYLSTPLQVSGSVNFAEMDTDGKMDILHGGAVLYGDGTGNFPVMKNFAANCVKSLAGDFNKDGYGDFACIRNYEAFADIYMSLRNRTYKLAQTIALPAAPGEAAALSDMNNDGHEDLVLGGYSGQLYVLAARGDGSFSAPVIISIDSRIDTVKTVKIGDFDEDGLKDIVVGHHYAPISPEDITVIYNRSAAPDNISPGRVSDLRAVFEVNSGNVSLSWTAPGDDGTRGSATEYDLRLAAVPLADDGLFSAASQVQGVQSPALAGTPESFTLSGLAGGSTYYFALKASDEVGNISALSNSPGIFALYVAKTTQTVEGGSPELGLVASTPTYITWISTVSGGGEVAIGSASAQGITLGSGLYEIGPDGIYDPPIVLTFYYSTAVLAAAGLSEADVAVYEHFSDGGWEKLPDQVLDMASHRITVPVTRIASLFGIFGIVRDNIPPVTRLSIAGVSYASDGRLYVSTLSVVALAAADPVVYGTSTGVAFTGFRVDSGTLAEYLTPFALPAGEHLVEFQSRDFAGNTEVLRSAEIFVDTTAPVGAIVFAGTAGRNGWHVSPVNVAITAADDGSGVRGINYSFDSGEYAAYVSSFTVSAEGTHAIAAYVTDNIGNAEAVRSAASQIDLSTPTADYSQLPAPNSLGWNNSAIDIVFSGTDAVSGIEYCSSSFTIIGEGKNISVEGYCRDYAGWSSTAAFTIDIDTTPPDVSYAAEPAANAAGWNNSDVAIKFTCEDALSGVKSCPEAMSLSGEGLGISTSALVIDNADNSKVVTVAGIKIDKTAPMALISSPTEGLVFAAGKGALVISFAAEDVLDVAPAVTATLVQTQDNGAPLGSGAASVVVVNGQTIDPMTIDDGLWRLEVAAADAAGNSTQVISGVFEVIHDTMAPITTLTVGEPKFSAEAVFVSSATPLSLSTTDDMLVAGDRQGVGAEFSYAMVDGAAATSVSGPLFIGLEGVHTLAYYSVDKAGNTELAKTAAFSVDNTAPEVGHAIAGSMFQGGELYVSTSTTIGLSAVELPSSGAASGLAAIYVADSTDTYKIYVGTFTALEGAHLYRYYAKDRLGNASEVKTLALTADGTPPVSVVGFSIAPSTEASGRLTISSDTYMWFVGADALSDAKSITYSIDGATPAVFASSFTLAAGAHSLAWWSVDNVGNAEPAQAAAIQVRGLTALSAVTVNFEPSVINLKSEGKYVEARLAVSSTTGPGFDEDSIRITKVNDVSLASPLYALAEHGNGKKDGSRGRLHSITVKFDRQALIAVLPADRLVKLTVEGSFDDDTAFMAEDYLRVINPGRIGKGRGGKVQHKSKACADIPAKGLKEDADITIVAMYERDAERREREDRAGTKGLQRKGEIYEFGPEGTVFDAPVTISLPYEPLEAGREKPVIAYWNPGKKDWEPLESELDAVEKVVKAKVGHFSLYQVVVSTAQDAKPVRAASVAAVPEAAGPSADFRLGEVYVYPNPAKGSDLPVIHVECGIADSVNIKIYTVSGREAHEVTLTALPAVIDDGNGQSYAYEYTWRGHIPSGVYLYYIEAQKGGQKLKKTGKFAVVR